MSIYPAGARGAYSPAAAPELSKRLTMDVLLLRLIHIGAGAFWVGSVFTFFLFVQPAAVAVGPEATKFTYQLIHHRRLPLVILASAVATVIAGLWLLIITS